MKNSKTNEATVNQKSTIYDIARALNLSSSTVSRALNNHPRISETTRHLVNETAEGLNYRRNSIAAALRNGKSKLLGVIVPRIGRTFFSEAVHGIEQVANRAGYFVTICQSHESYENEVASVEALVDARVDGILVSCSRETTNFDHFQKVIDRNIPLIFFDRVVDALNINMVSIDDFAGAYEATKHLIVNGYKRIAHLTITTDLSIYKNRLSGYKHALMDFGLEVDPDLIVRNDLQLTDGIDAMRMLMQLPVPPDAVFSASALAAVGAAQYVKTCKLEIPQQFGVIGFSDESFTSITDPPLSIIDQHSYRIGNAAAELFLKELKEGPAKVPKQVVIRPTLIVRESTQRASVMHSS